jgi:NLI interacting factor-like phosphatase
MARQTSRSSALPDNRQSQEEHQSVGVAADADTNMDVNGDSASAPAPAPVVQAIEVVADQPRSTSQANANVRPIRQSRRLQQRAERNAWLNAQGPQYTSFPPAPFQTDHFYNDNGNGNDNYNNYMDSAQGQHGADNNFMSQNFNPNSNQNPNPNNMVNFGWGPNYAASNPTPSNPPSAALQQSQLLQMHFAQHMMMAQQMFSAAGNGLPFNNAGPMQQQPIRSMSTVLRTTIRPTQNFDPNMATPDAATQSQDDDNNNQPGGQPKSRSNAVQPPEPPVPWPSYLDQAHKEPKDLDWIQPLLVILDLNGTLLYRKRKKFPPQFIRRPALNYFLERLTSRHVVMVWSSSRPETVNAICDDLFSDGQNDKLIARWGRDKLGLSDSQYYAKVQVYKELEKVWADPKIQSKYPQSKKVKAGVALYNVLRRKPDTAIEMEMTGVQGHRWDQSNTVLIDDSTIKAAANPYNILEVPEFTNAPDDDDTTVLKTVLRTLRTLAKSNDVSRRLRSWGEDGNKISRDEVLGSSSEESSASGSELESDLEEEGEEEEEDEKPTENKKKQKEPVDNLVYETDNKIVPQSLSQAGPSFTPNNKRNNNQKQQKWKKKQKKLKSNVAFGSKQAGTDADGDLILTGAEASDAGAASAGPSTRPRTTGGKKKRSRKGNRQAATASVALE